MDGIFWLLLSCSVVQDADVDAWGVLGLWLSQPCSTGSVLTSSQELGWCQQGSMHDPHNMHSLVNHTCNQMGKYGVRQGLAWLAWLSDHHHNR